MLLKMIRNLSKKKKRTKNDKCFDIIIDDSTFGLYTNNGKL